MLRDRAGRVLPRISIRAGPANLRGTTAADQFSGSRRRIDERHRDERDRITSESFRKTRDLPQSQPMVENREVARAEHQPFGEERRCDAVIGRMPGQPRRNSSSATGLSTTGRGLKALSASLVIGKFSPKSGRVLRRRHAVTPCAAHCADYWPIIAPPRTTHGKATLVHHSLRGIFQ